MPNLFYATNEQASILHEHDSGTFVRLLKEQSPDYQWNINAEYWSCIDIPLRYPSGLYKVKEIWAPPFLPGDTWLYKAEPSHHKHLMASGWNSSINMPANAIRTRIKIETEVKRVQELRGAILNGMSYIPRIELSNFTYEQDEDGSEAFRLNFMHYWNSLHTRPVRIGNEYACYPYNMESFLQLYGNNKQLFHGQWTSKTNLQEAFGWNNQPLRVYSNPYIEVLNWTVEWRKE